MLSTETFQKLHVRILPNFAQSHQRQRSSETHISNRCIFSKLTGMTLRRSGAGALAELVAWNWAAPRSVDEERAARHCPRLLHTGAALTWRAAVWGTHATGAGAKRSEEASTCIALPTAQ